MEDIAENEQMRQERNEVFASVAEEGKDEMLEELDRLEAEALGGEIQGNIVNSNRIEAPASAAAADPVEAQLAALRTEMVAELNAL